MLTKVRVKSGLVLHAYNGNSYPLRGLEMQAWEFRVAGMIHVHLLHKHGVYYCSAFSETETSDDVELIEEKAEEKDPQKPQLTGTSLAHMFGQEMKSLTVNFKE